MRYALVLLAVLAAAAQAHAGDEDASRRAAIEHAALPERVFRGQALVLWLEVRVDEAWFAQHGVGRFAQHMDLPLAIDAPALRGPPGTALLSSPQPEDLPRRRVVVNGEALEVTLGMLNTKRDATFLVLGRRLMAERLGPLDIAAPTLRFTYAEAFGEDALGNRVPMEPRDVVVAGHPQRVTVATLPAVGRPTDFGGAIGKFTLAAAADRKDVEVGATFRLTLTIGGEGNLEAFEPPRLNPRAGFHVYGVTDDRGFPRRTVVYDLAPQTSKIASVPALTLEYFDPNPPASYRTVSSAPIPLTVRPSPGGPTPPAASPAPTAEGDTNGSPGLGAIVGGLVAALLLVVGTVLVRRRGRRRQDATIPDAEEERLQAALTHLQAQARMPGADLYEGFAEVLAALLRQPRAAAVAPDLAARLTAAGVAGDRAAAAASAMERLVGARYGGASLDASARDGIFTLAARLAPSGGRRNDA